VFLARLRLQRQLRFFQNAQKIETNGKKWVFLALRSFRDSAASPKTPKKSRQTAKYGRFSLGSPFETEQGSWYEQRKCFAAASRQFS
jgi:hypothetical protein